MSQQRASELLYQGEQGYVSLHEVTVNGKAGAVFRYANPNKAKMHAVDTAGMLEMEQALSVLESNEDLEFCVFHGAYDVIHAGADITEFRGDCDVDAIDRHLSRGTSLDARIKKLWPRMRTVGVFTGDRYGGSVEWPMFAEWGICDSSSRIQLSEVHLGIIPGWNGVLNVLLKCGPERAKWMGQTGNTLQAADMLAIGIVQDVIETPQVPDLKGLSPDEWAAAWEKHAAAAEPILLEAAFRLASADAQPVRNVEFDDSAEGRQKRDSLLKELQDEIAQRTDVSRYRKLHDEVAKQAADLRRAGDEDGIRALAKTAVKEVSKLRKPLAPMAVKAVGNYVAEWSRFNRDEILQQYAEAGQMEADLCTSLMDTEHRRIGVNAVLSRVPEDKVPVFS